MLQLRLRGRHTGAAVTGAVACLALLGAAGDEVTLQPRAGDPLPGLDVALLERFAAGRIAFNSPLAQADGLGPVFNDNSCRNCHNQPVTGGFSTRTVTRFGKAATGGSPFDPLGSLGGSLLQEQAISASCEESVPAEADVVVERGTPALFGIGLVEAIDDAVLLDRAANQPPGLSGVAHMVTPLEGGPQRVGRFGWKGDIATVLTFSGDAAMMELGLSNDLIPFDNAPNGDLATLAACDSVADPEDVPDSEGFRMIDRFTDYQRLLAAPPQTPRSGMTGETLFASVGCADCHVPTVYEATTSLEPSINGRSFKPYSDFLLHDMGTLGDGVVSGSASEQLMMTRPLWGMKGRIALLHDSASTGGTFRDIVLDCIDRHDGEAAASRAAYQALSVAEQDLVVTFLDSLGQVEFDFEGDNDVDFIDWFFIEPQVTGPGTSFTPDDQQALSDVDQDGDIDLIDFGYLQRAFTGEL